MTLQTISFIFGALLILVGILGGGFEVKELKIPKVHIGSRLISSFAGVLFISFAVWLSFGKVNIEDSQVRMSDMEWDTDRFGADYTGLTLPTDNPELCKDACRSDSNCKAWTYVKPNTIRGPKPICYLKIAIPPPQDNVCCVSGTKTE